jgi:DNA-binding transcriptional ArsR family regulator
MIAGTPSGHRRPNEALAHRDRTSYSCIMVQTRKRPPATPRAAAACCRPVDDLLDPGLFRALGDPTRVRLFGCLVKCARPCSVGEIADCCDVDLSVVSRHLKTLGGAGLVEATRAGRTVRYAASHAEIADRMRRLAAAIEECGPPSPPRTATRVADRTRRRRRAG